VAALVAVGLASRACGGEEKVAERPAPTPVPTSTPTATATPKPKPAATSTPAPAKRARRGARGELAVGLTEQNANLVAAPGARPMPPQFAAWQGAVGRLRPELFRLVLDWPSLQPGRGTPANLAAYHDGCVRTTPPCAGWAGVRDQLAALASRQQQQPGSWRVLVVITGTPDWAARPAAGCERRGTESRSRAPRPDALRAYERLVERVIELGAGLGVELRYWSAWNEPNHPYFISPQRASCSTATPSLAVARYAELTRALDRALDRAPGDQEYVLGELAGLDVSKPQSTSIQEFVGGLPRGIVCGSRIISQHGYITGIDPVDDVAAAVARRRCGHRHVVWMTETGVGAPHAGEDKRTTPTAERRACRALHRRLVRWYRDRRVAAAFQYTFREDDLFRTGLVSTSLRRAFPVLREWQAWGGAARPRPADPPPRRARC
jgi:hypothetical protein